MKVWFVVFALCLFALPLFAADAGTQTQLLAIDSAFVQGKYANVELLTLRLLQSNATLLPQERSRVNLTAGYALIMEGREQDARGYFERALDAEPNLTLDPVQVSPKFRVVFDEVKASYQSPKTSINPPAPVHAEPGPSQSALLSNLILPGTGQWREGHRLRGGAFLIAQAASVILLVNQISRAQDSHEVYLAQTNPQRITSTYSAYNKDYKLAWGEAAIVGAIYLAAQADLILNRQVEKQIAIYPIIGNSQGLGIRLYW